MKIRASFVKGLLFIETGVWFTGIETPPIKNGTSWFGNGRMFVENGMPGSGNGAFFVDNDVLRIKTGYLFAENGLLYFRGKSLYFRGVGLFVAIGWLQWRLALLQADSGTHQA